MLVIRPAIRVLLLAELDYVTGGLRLRGNGADLPAHPA